MPSNVSRSILLLGLAGVFACRPASAGDLVERVVAVVDGRTLCLSDVRAVERLDSLGGAEALERLIDETLLYREAVRLPQAASAAQEAVAQEPMAAVPDGPRQRALHRRAVIRRYVTLR